MKRLFFLAFTGMLFLLSFKTNEVTISGLVTDKMGSPLKGVVVSAVGQNAQTSTNVKGHYEISIPANVTNLVFKSPGYQTKQVKIAGRQILNVQLSTAIVDEVDKDITKSSPKQNQVQQYAAEESFAISTGSTYNRKLADQPYQPNYNTEEYANIDENIFHSPIHKPLSTFSIDVDAASYSNIRRFINYGQLPPKDAVRVEEMINYFNYDYPQPAGENPFAIYSEVSQCPWNDQHQLVHIGLQGKNIDRSNLPASNLVFLLDVSGSMNSPDKLPLLKSAFKMLVNQMNENDRVAIVVYAGAAGEVLPSTPGNNKAKILEAIDNLSAGGSTAGGEGIKLAYKIAAENFIAEGNNRIILATDGDFNIGVSSEGAMEDLVVEKRKSGVYLTVLGFGTGNYKDNKMEILADKGNGNYAYIDNINEAKKVVVNQMAGTLFTIAKDVKIQVEFNPAKVKAFRLIGYENRKLNDEDFNDDKKDAGELGVGHTVTALYEIIPHGVNSDFDKGIDELKYQKNVVSAKNEEMLTLKLRYKAPDGMASKLITKSLQYSNVSNAEASENFRFSAAVAAFGMLLRESEYSNNYTFTDVFSLAQESLGEDKDGYRREFLEMVESCKLMAVNE
jgi:Ca-activated chloride channel homolog